MPNHEVFRGGYILNAFVQPRVLGNPMQVLGLKWCLRCKTEVDTDNEAANRSGIYVFKCWCQKCGEVIAYGVYNPQLVGGVEGTLQAREWVTKPMEPKRYMWEGVNNAKV